MHVEQNQNYFTPHLECTGLVYSSLHTPHAPAKCEEPIHHIAESVANKLVYSVDGNLIFTVSEA
jgi:hypothetical protein